MYELPYSLGIGIGIKKINYKNTILIPSFEESIEITCINNGLEIFEYINFG